MTDKQIIDRVNIKECKYYCNGKCERYEEFVEANYANYSVKCICEKENDLGTYDICDYQLLKRKEQECERKSRGIGNLGYKIKNQRKEINERLKQLKAKEQENNSLQAQVNNITVQSNNTITALEQENEELKQAFIEIKEIAENMNKECFYNDFDCEDCDMKNGCTYFNKKQILQKIKEAIK